MLIRKSTIDKYVGRRYGRLVIESFQGRDPKNRNHYFVNCVCDCGNKSITRISCLQQGSSTSCGCLGKEKRLAANTGNTYRRLALGVGCRNRLFSRYGKDAERRGLSFNLSVERFAELTASNCFYCDRKPASSLKAAHGYGAYIYNGIDRVDNSLGYTVENCVPCCKNCNAIKNGITKEMVFRLGKKLGFF